MIQYRARRKKDEENLYAGPFDADDRTDGEYRH